MNEKPILFNGEMVRAILDGRKTMTRRPVKHTNPFLGSPKTWKPYDCDDGYGFESDDEFVRCPFGKPGSKLWVRERFALLPQYDHLPPSQCDDRGIWWHASLPIFPEGYASCHGKWRPSIHMPRCACRVILKITDIRVERLNYISRHDAKQEGFWPSELNGLEQWNGRNYGNAQLAFKACWDDTYGKKHPWSSNPWVWVVSFKLIK